MKFTTKQENFSKALNKVSRVVSNRTTLPVLGNILISAKNGKIKLSATDLEIGIISQTLGKIEEDGDLTVPARLLADFILNNNDEVIEFTTKDQVLKLKSTHYQANISGISSEEFPTIPSLTKEVFVSIKRTVLIEALKKVAIVPMNDETRPVLAGVLFDFSKNKLTMAATDSYRLAEKHLKFEGEILEEKKIIIPIRTVNEVLRLIGGDLSENILISSSETQLAFKIGDTEVVSRLIEGTFPNYAQIVPSSFKIKVETKLADLVPAIKMVSLFAKENANNIKLKTKNEELSILTDSSQTGDALSKIPAKVSGKDIEISFNVKYLTDIMQVITGDVVELGFNDDSSPSVIRTANDPDFIYIVMPLKISE